MLKCSLELLRHIAKSNIPQADHPFSQLDRDFDRLKIVTLIWFIILVATQYLRDTQHSHVYYTVPVM